MSGGDKKIAGHLPGLRTTLIGLGITCLAGAVVLSLVAVLAMKHPYCYGACVLSDVPVALWSVSGVAAALLVGAIAALWRSRYVALAIAVASLLALGAGAIARSKVASFRTPLFEDNPWSQQLPAAAAGYWLTMGGALLIASAASFGSVGRPRKYLLVGLVVGTVAAIAVCIGVSKFRTSGPQLEVTAATATEIPSIPNQLGQREFRIALGKPHSSGSSTVRVLTAGASFVLWDLNRNAVTAYDSSGHERWSFRKMDGPWFVGAHVYDQGRTIVLAQQIQGKTIDQPMYFTALDAMTGRQLWAGSGSRLNSAFYAGWQNVSPFLVARDDDTWTAFDSRTGEVAWEIPSPMPCGGLRTGDTVDLLVGISHCRNDGDAYEFHMASVDPKTGEVLVSRRLGQSPGLVGRSEINVGPAGSGGIAVGYPSATPEDPHGYASMYIEAASGNVTEFPNGGIAALDWPVGGFASRVGDRFGLIDTDGRLRCTITYTDNLQFVGSYGEAQAAWLGEQFVYYEYDNGYVLRSINRSDCRPGVPSEVSGIVMSMVAAPGVLAMVIIDDDGTIYLDGYA